MSLYRILIVDDDEENVLIQAAVLKRAGYDVEWATNGWEGIAKARSLRPDLVLLDVVMPEMDGWTFMKFVRAHRDLAALPVIFLSGRGSAADLRRGRALGADDYLVKPVAVSALASRVARVLDRRGGAVPAGTRLLVQDTSAPSPNFHLKGRLDQLSLMPLLALLGAGRRTGTLTVNETLGGASARIFLRDGRMVGASLESADVIGGLEALEAVSKWCEGEFAFSAGEVPEPEDPALLVPAV